jgi:hypothetical protein
MNYYGARAQGRQDRIAANAAARRMVKEGLRDDDDSTRPSGLKAILARLRKHGSAR